MRPPCIPTTDSGLGNPVFLPDNCLRLPRLMGTRKKRDKRAEVVKHFTFSELAATQTNESIPKDTNTAKSSEHSTKDTLQMATYSARSPSGTPTLRRMHACRVQPGVQTVPRATNPRASMNKPMTARPSSLQSHRHSMQRAQIMRMLQRAATDSAAQQQ